MSDIEVWKFDQFEFQPAIWRLLHKGEPKGAQRRNLEVLRVLLENPRRPVKRTTLYERVWGTVFVESSALNAQINLLRSLGITSITTVKKVGYELTADVVRIRGVAAQPLSVPGTLTAMIGRETEAVDVCELLQGCPVVCIQGSCGSGKTLLARQVADRRQAEHAHGLRWIDLSAVESVEVMFELIKSGTQPVALPDGPAGHVDRDAADLDMLVVLDNADRWAADLPTVLARLCSKSPRLRVLITSQVQTGSPLEQVFHLGVLPIPSEGVNAAAAAKHGAVKMFVACARASDSAFRLTDGNVGRVISICQALDGLPLALKLAASRVHAIGVAALDDKLRSLRQGFVEVRVAGPASAETPMRHISLEAAVAWSHGLLDPAQQKMFRRMAVFARAATLPLLEAVIPDASELDENAPDIMDTLKHLVERGLATRVDEGQGKGTSFRLLEAPKAYALARLKAAGEPASMRLQHAKALDRLSRASWSQPDDGDVPFDDWQLQAMVLLDEAAAAFEWARGARAWNLMLQLGAFQLRAQPRSAYRQRQSVAAACTDALSQRMVLPAVLGHRIHIELARFWMGSRPETAQAHARKSLNFSQSAGFKNDAEVDAKWGEYQSMALDCVAAAARGDVDGAEQALFELQACKPDGWPHPARAVWGLQARAAVAMARHDWTSAVELLTDRVSLARSAGNRGQREFSELIEATVLAGGQDDVLLPHSFAEVGPVADDETRCNIRIAECAVLLNAGHCERALPPIAEGFSSGRSQQEKLAWADLAALLKVLQARATESTRILGWTDVGYRVMNQVRSRIAKEAYARARALALAALGDAEFVRWERRGAVMSDQEIKDLIGTP